MKRLLCPLLFALVALWLGACTKIAPVRQGAAVAEATEHAQHPVFMWRIDSATAIVHLLGSIHVGSPDMYPLDERIERAFRQSDALVLEIDMDEEAEAQAALAFVEMALLPRGETLDDQLDLETRALLHVRLEELGMPYENVQMFQPWFVAMTLEMKQMEDAGYSGEYGIDQHFRDQAVGKKEILELESIEEQSALFASLTEDAQTDELRMALDADDAGAQMLSAMAEQWRVGNTLLIEEEVERTQKEYPEAYESLYASRNRKMTRKVLEYLLTDKDYFVVAGGAHMVGDEGIVELLRKNGHEVIQQ